MYEIRARTAAVFPCSDNRGFSPLSVALALYNYSLGAAAPNDSPSAPSNASGPPVPLGPHHPATSSFGSSGSLASGCIRVIPGLLEYLESSAPCAGALNQCSEYSRMSRWRGVSSGSWMS